MDTIFNPETQYITLKQSYIDLGEVIYIYKGSQSPAFTIDPTNYTYEYLLTIFYDGYIDMFDIQNII